MGNLVTDTGREEPYFVSYVRGRIQKKKNFLVLIKGQTGSGKSWSGISIACQLDKNFSPQRIIFGFRNLMRLINSGENFPAGTCFVWDEFQIDAGARSWQSLTNRLLNSLLSTFRHKNFILIVTTPYPDFIDSQSRKLFHAEFETLGIDYKRGTTKLKPLLIQYNSRNKKFYYKYLRVHRGVKGVSPIKAWNVPKPPDWLIDEYERMKTEFTSALNKDIEMQLDQLEAKKSGKSIATQKPLTEKQEDVLKLMAEGKNTKQVAEEVGIAERTVHFHVAQARKKGYTAEEFKENDAT